MVQPAGYLTEKPIVGDVKVLDSAWLALDEGVAATDDEVDAAGLEPQAAATAAMTIPMVANRTVPFIACASISGICQSLATRGSSKNSPSLAAVTGLELIYCIRRVQDENEPNAVVEELHGNDSVA